MRPATKDEFPQANLRLTGDGQVGELHALAIRPTTESPYPRVLTCWHPTPEEREAIAAGGPVWLDLLTSPTAVPPLCVTAHSPFEADPELPDPERPQWFVRSGMGLVLGQLVTCHPLVAGEPVRGLQLLGFNVLEDPVVPDGFVDLVDTQGARHRFRLPVPDDRPQVAG